MSAALPAKEPIAEIASLDDLRRLAEEVRADKKPRLVAIAGGGEITLAPVGAVKKKRSQMTAEEKVEADRRAFLSSAGALEGLFDAEEFKRQYWAARGSGRQPVDLSELDE
jgi:hypothetical protein